MSRAKLWAGGIGVGLALIAICLGLYQFRWPISWMFPIEHTGKGMRIAQFHKGGFTSRGEGTRQLRQFAIFFDDGFDCEASDTSFAAVFVRPSAQARISTVLPSLSCASMSMPASIVGCTSS